MDQHEDIQLGPGYFFSPGFYMNYWRDTILTNFEPQIIAFHGRLKQHREMWVGAHLAALKTHLSGNKHFVALPERDPPDVLVGSFTEVTLPSGRIGRNLGWFPIEITRCDASANETLYQQIISKNTSSYTNTVLAVYLQGTESLPDLNELSEQLRSLDHIFLHEIIVMVELRANAAIPQGTFGFVQIYPSYDSVIVERTDTTSYFTEPNSFRVTGLGVQETMANLGTIRLVAPQINM